MREETKRFLVTGTGRKTAVVLSLREYRELMEDLRDLATIAERRGEPSESLDVVKKKLEKKWQSTESR